MFCGKCGIDNPEGAAFCRTCGAPLKNAAAPAAAPAPAPAGDSRRNRIIGIAVVAVAVVVVIILLTTLFGGRSYKSTATKFLDAAFDGNAKEIVALLPDEVVDQVLDEMGYRRSEMDDALDELDEQFYRALGYLTDRFGDDLKISYSVESAEDVSDSTLSSLKSHYNLLDLKVSAAKNVEVKMTFQSDGVESSYQITIPMIKVGRTWYLDAMSFSGVF